MWNRLKPRLESKRSASEAIQDLLGNPYDENAVTILRLQMKKILVEDPNLALKISGLINDAYNSGLHDVNLEDKEIVGSNIDIIESDVIRVDKNVGIRPRTSIDLNKALKEIGKKYFKVSIAHPILLSKRFESSFLVQIYFQELNSRVKAKIRKVIGEDYSEHIYATELKFGQVVKVKLYSPDITFSAPVSKKLKVTV